MRLAATTQAIRRAARVLAGGGLVAFPTETVYGLGADATNGEAVAGIFAAKGRPHFNPLIVHVAAPEDAASVGLIAGPLALIADTFWPGPITIVTDLAAAHPIAPLATAGLPTVAIRCPAHPVACDLIGALGRPVVAPSANRSGHVSPTTADHVVADLGREIDLVLDGGACPVGVESTIVARDPDHPAGVVVLRAGGVTVEDIQKVVGATELVTAGVVGQTPNAPGQLESHYAPSAEVWLNATPEMIAGADAVLAFGPAGLELTGSHQTSQTVLNLSPQGSLVAAAANLFSHLRALDAAGAKTIAVQPIPKVGLGRAINDRLTRAAAPRCGPGTRST